ncbi:UNVERIFIED_CONTAM: hypothetical protein PYX00_002877 [Menopon gallinae]|uniref:DBB domain-containing protein n=1 Tax=Menopon gallinae TaxID=328185 RepID=A0AAW2HY36_9NEOP
MVTDPGLGAKSSDMEDILIISSNRSQAADLWVQYLRTCFDQIRKNRSKPPFRILSLGIEDFGTDSLSPMLEEKLRSVKLAIMIVCPVFLEHVVQFPEHGINLTKNFRPERVLAMLLGVEEAAVTDDHKAGLVNYNQWKRKESLKNRDEKFVGDFLGVAMDIISKSGNQQVQNGEKCHFMLMPKKVNKSQNKVLILLNEPITKEDAITVKVIRNNEVFEMPSVKKRNPYTVIFRMPEEFLTVSMLVNVAVERNGQDLGSKLLKCESQLYALDQILRSCDNAVEFMCQALNIVPYDKDKLEDFLVAAFQKNVPPNFNLLQTSGLGHLHRGVISKEEYPTLLHFAARFGLEKLAWMLLECPGGELACEIRNICELTPSEMAESAGHSKLANALCGYMQMTEFTSVYTYLKGMSDDKQSISKSDCSDDYLNPRPVSETYQVPPSPRPLAQSCSQPPVGYMQMHSPKCMKSKSENASQNDDASLRSSNEKLKQRKNSTESAKKEDSDGSKRSRENSGNGIQEELIEIINDFKNNVFTISEVEKLVENWRNRNDVQQSFKEKQDQLMRMREEYERVQQKLKEEMKEVGRQSPMERLRNFFRGKSKEGKHAESHESGKKAKQAQDTSLGNRPASSLSIQSISSSSSGRLSTGSHCSGMSLGDSGTHSDPESERKYRSGANGCCTHRRGKDAAENYDVPPSPVALLASKQKMSNGIPNYDIPPVPVTQNVFVCSRFNGVHLSTPPPCVVETQPRETFYYNLPSPVPNESVLHNQLAKASSKNCLQALEECAESKTDEKATPLEYMNLPSVDGRVTAKYVVIEDEEKLPSLDANLPNYVNVEPPEVEISCK